MSREFVANWLGARAAGSSTVRDAIATLVFDPPPPNIRATLAFYRRLFLAKGAVPTA